MNWRGRHDLSHSICLTMIINVLYFKKKYLFMIALGLHSCMGGGDSLVVMCGLLAAVASLLQCMGSRA